MAIALIVLGALLVLIGVLVVKTLFLYALPLVIDRRLDFWQAMQLSRKVNARVFWPLIGLLLLVFVINLAGALACLVGALFTAPLGMLMLVCGYEQLFGEPAGAAA